MFQEKKKKKRANLNQVSCTVWHPLGVMQPISYMCESLFSSMAFGFYSPIHMATSNSRCTDKLCSLSTAVCERKYCIVSSVPTRAVKVCVYREMTLWACWQTSAQMLSFSSQRIDAHSTWEPRPRLTALSCFLNLQKEKKTLSWSEYLQPHC